MTYATLDDLAHHLEELRGYDPDYFTRMMHKVPHVPVVDRAAFLVEQCRGKRVLHLGCAGPLHQLLKPVCTALYGVDRGPQPMEHYYDVDLDEHPENLPTGIFLDWVLMGEVLEHLGNPGRLLATVRLKYTCPVIISVPNAFARAGAGALQKGYEQVNLEHVAWYSWRTLTTLVERYGYTVDRWYWYNGQQLTAKGLIVEAH